MAIFVLAHIVHDKLLVTLKLLIIGDTASGKSSIMNRFTDNTFTDDFMGTIGVDFKFKNIVIDNCDVKIQIWDTAGQERFRTITKTYYRGAHGVIIVYDVTDKISFRHVSGWIEEFMRANNHEIGVKTGKKDLEREGRPLIPKFFFATGLLAIWRLKNQFKTIQRNSFWKITGR